MMMEKISNSEDVNVALHNVEGFVSDKLSDKLSELYSGGDPLIGIGDLMESIDTKMSRIQIKQLRI
jgi:hypothetical protein